MNEDEFILNKVCEVFSVPREKVIKGSKRREKIDSSYYRYFVINYLEEHTDKSREEMGNFLGLKHSSVTAGLKSSSNLFVTRDILFNDMLEKLNNVLEDKIKMDSKLVRYKRRKLTNQELYHLKFMYSFQIPEWKLADHFRCSLPTIKYHIKNFKNKNI